MGRPTRRPVDEELEDRVRRLEYATWGLRGDNGMVSDIKAIRTELERQGREKVAASRAVILALLAAIIALIGTIASVLVAVG